MTPASTQHEDVQHGDTRPAPGFWGSLTYLLLNFPLGILAFVLLTTWAAVGVGTAIIWLGVPLLALLVLGWRGAARLERARLYALLDTWVPMPYRSLPEGSQRERWKARLGDPATWRDLAYLVLLFPLGIAQFTLMVAFWATSLSLVALPVYFRYLPGGTFHLPSDGWSWFAVDSTFEALPWAALGVFFAALSVALTKAIAGAHARFARVLLGPAGGTPRHEDAGIPVDAPYGVNAVAGW
ncbi:two-component system sensor kinase [Amycolatopsis antarctica]|uniref:Two-component system sensor kinase n=1 Tax=Amycolatopsis antarctica TaxID=1854586 RepID=A0A263CV31_9PSEU|nr:sensor domain-containing protein [Amycolatopsis antarctica]OZM69983.1 two-component system sensor kinase [Amycolatopsis antarctica]